jgi:hypothetical protein
MSEPSDVEYGPANMPDGVAGLVHHYQNMPTTLLGANMTDFTWQWMKGSGRFVLSKTLGTRFVLVGQVDVAHDQTKIYPYGNSGAKFASEVSISEPSLLLVG